MNEQDNKPISKLSKDILVLICKAHKLGKEAISFDEICKSLKENRNRYRKKGVKSALGDLCQKDYLCRGTGSNGYILKPMMGQIIC